MAGTNGFYLPYILRTVGDQGQAMVVGLQCGARISLGIWSFFVPAITAAGFHTLAWILTGFVSVSALLGILFAPSNVGKTLEELEREQTGGRRFVRESERASSRQPVG